MIQLFLNLYGQSRFKKKIDKLILRVEKGEKMKARDFFKLMLLYLVTSVVIFLIMTWEVPVVQMSWDGNVSQTEYSNLKRNAIEVAKKLDVKALDDMSLESNYYLIGNELVVEVESMRAKVVAKSHLSDNIIEDIKKGNCKGISTLANVQYVETSKMITIPYCIFISMSLAIICTVVVAFVIKVITTAKS